MTGSLLPGTPLPPCAHAGAGGSLVLAPGGGVGVLASHGHPTWEAWGPLEWAIVGVGGAISLWVIWLAVRHTFRPGEQAEDHVKRSILDDEDRAMDPVPPPPPPRPPSTPAPPTARR